MVKNDNGYSLQPGLMDKMYDDRKEDNKKKEREKKISERKKERENKRLKKEKDRKQKAEKAKKDKKKKEKEKILGLKIVTEEEKSLENFNNNADITKDYNTIISNII